MSNCDQLLNYFIGICAAFATLRFLNLLRFSKLIIVFLIAFKKSLKELVSFGVIFFVIWLSFVQTIYLIFNAQSYQFSTFLNTMATCFQIILGKFNSDTFFKADTILGPFIFMAYNICIVFVMLNIFITILLEYFNLARNDHDLDRGDPELFKYLKSILSPLLLFSKTKKSDEPVYYVFWETLPMTFDSYISRIHTVINFFSIKYYFFMKGLSHFFNFKLSKHISIETVIADTRLNQRNRMLFQPLPNIYIKP